MVFVFLALTSFSITPSRSIQVVANGKISLVLLPNNTPLQTRARTSPRGHLVTGVEGASLPGPHEPRHGAPRAACVFSN